MSITLPTLDLAGTTVGSTGSLDLTRAVGQGGISYAEFGQATLRLHNESNCGLQCSLPISGQSFYLPAGGWQDCYPKGGDNALDYEVLYTLSGPGVTLLLATYFYPGDQVPPVTQLGNSPIGGGNVSTNFSELINTGNNPLSTLINVQPNDASAPTWTADTSGNHLFQGDNAGALTQLLQLIAGATPGVNLGSVGALTDVLGMLHVEHTLTANGGINVSTIRDNTAGGTQITLSNTSPQTAIANDLSVGGIVDIAGKTAVVSGGGTCTLYQSFGGTGYKKAIVYLNAYRNGNVSAQLLALPTAFTAGATVIVGNIGNSSQWGGFQLLHNTNPVSAEVLTTLASTGGSGTAVTTLYGLSIAHVAGAFDTVAMQSSGVGTAFTGFIIIEGI